ncbi:unnamed protein product [Auanema sp. JU1783]|nr:unnamed protein product [Auanema sp. JU1783]
MLPHYVNTNNTFNLHINHTTVTDDATSECFQSLVFIANQINNQAWSDYKNSREHKRGADIYIIAILGVFASVIVCLLFRSVRKSENVDDQIHVDYEERERQRRKLKEDKGRAQAWLTQLGLRGMRRLRGRSSSYHGAKERISTGSVPNTLRFPALIKPPSRAKSFQGFLPEIVVTHHNYSNQNYECHLSTAISAPNSRPSSQCSRLSSDLSCKSEAFLFEEPVESDVFSYNIEDFP